MRWIHGVQARLRLLRRGAAEERMDEEIRFHIEMETERNLRSGMSPEEARRRAVLAFGGVEGHKEEMREGRTLAWLGGMSLDLKLGARAMRRSPGLSAIGAFAIAVGVAFGALGFELLSKVLQTRLPLEEGDRVVSIQYATDNPGNPERRILHDFTEWRGQLATVEELGAYHTVELNLVGGDAPPEPVEAAAITAAGLAVGRTPPLLGRPLLPEDEQEGAPAVVVIGHAAWTSRFGGDPDVVGRVVQLGGSPHVVVGVMPEGFRFPLNHQYWIPLRAHPADHPRLQGPSLYVFGRLAPGVGMKEAQAELAVLGQRAAAAHPETHERLRLRVVPYAHEHMDVDHPAFAWFLRIVRLLFGGLLVVVAVNLAVLVYARTVGRMGELAVRSALGASRRRILGQLFLEALTLAVLGAALGLAIARFVLGWVGRQFAVVDDIPFWIDFGLSPGTVAYVLALAALAAAIMGVLPGIKVTGSRLAGRLHELGGGTGPRLGRVWTTLIVAQVGIAVAILPLSVFAVSRVIRTERVELGFPAEAFAVGSFGFGEGVDLPAGDAWEGSPAQLRFAARQRELRARLEAEPGVAAVAFSRGIPGVQGITRRIELDDGPAAEGAMERAAEPVRADAVLFDAYGAAVVAGRGFREGDANGAGGAVVVNRSWVRHFLGDAPALGRRFRYAARRARDGAELPPEPWYEIVGVVEDFPAVPLGVEALGGGGATVYHPISPGEVHPVTVSVRFRGPLPPGAAGRIREIGAGLDPEMHLSARPLSELYGSLRSGSRLLAWGFGVFTSAVLLLSAAGIYALMSFTVARRTREIGIRSALGADARRVLGSVFAGAVRQLALGVGIGCLLGGTLILVSGFGADQIAWLLTAAPGIILVVGGLATLGPARRGLRIQPSEALRAE